MDTKNEVPNVINWIKNYVHNSGARGVVVGNSGGKDSAVVIALATKALGSENVTGIIMPCHSNLKDLDDAKLVTETFKIKSMTIDLTESYNQMENYMNFILSKEAAINVKPRLRMTTLYAIAQTLGYLVIGTSNLSEITVGYTTKWGDAVSDFNPLANFLMEEVLEIGKELGVPEKILSKPPADGLSELTDEQKMGVSYKEISNYILNKKASNDEITEKIQKLYDNSKHKRNGIEVYKREN